MTLGEKQERFARMRMLLYIHLHALGYSIRAKHLLRCPGCKVGARNSVHKYGLAEDLVLSISPAAGDRPRVLTGRAAEKAHAKGHDYWDSIEGAKRIPGDFGHYSLDHNGMR